MTTVLLLLAALLAARIPGAATALAGLGQRSYFLYFAHFWVLGAIVGIVLARWGVLPDTWLWIVYGLLFSVATVVSWLISGLSWRWLESPIIDAGRAFAARQSR